MTLSERDKKLYSSKVSSWSSIVLRSFGLFSMWNTQIESAWSKDPVGNRMYYCLWWLRVVMVLERFASPSVFITWRVHPTSLLGRECRPTGSRDGVLTTKVYKLSDFLLELLNHIRAYIYQNTWCAYLVHISLCTLYFSRKSTWK